MFSEHIFLKTSLDGCFYNYDFMEQVNDVVPGKMRLLVISESTTSEWISFWHWNWYSLGIITPYFEVLIIIKITSITSWKVQAICCRRLDLLFLIGSFHNAEQNEKPKSTFILVIKLLIWDNKQTKNNGRLKEFGPRL